jgi:hypothetical protein
MVSENQVGVARPVDIRTFQQMWQLACFETKGQVSKQTHVFR